MAYTKQTWENLPSQTTPINADRLTHIEDGIFDAAATADTAASNASSAISGLADKVDKVEGKGLSTNDFTDALQTKLDNIESGAEVNVQSDYAQTDTTADDYIKNKPTLGTSAYKNSTSVVTDSTDLVESGAVKDIVGWGNKNLLPITLAMLKSFNTIGVWTGDVYTLNNVAFTFDVVNGYVVAVIVNGQATANGSLRLFEYPLDLYGKRITINGCPANGGSTNYRIFGDGIGYDTGEGVTGICPSTSGQRVGITVFSGYAVNNLKFEPMIRLATVTDATYEPYHASVEDTLRDAEVVEGKNLISGALFSSVSVNVSVSVNADNSVLFTGKANGTTRTPTFSENFILKAGTYILNGCTGGSDNSYGLRVGLASTGNEVAICYNGDVSFTLNADTEVKMIGRLSANYTDAYNVTMYPMIRKATETDPTYEPYYTPLKDVVPNKCDNSVIAPVENGTTASQAYAVGQHFIRDGAFCTCTQAIAQGGTFTLNTNYTAGDVADLLNVESGTIIAGDDSRISLDSDKTKIYKQGNVVNFKVRFTLSENIVTANYIAICFMPWAPKIVHPYFTIRDREAPYHTVSSCYIDTNNSNQCYIIFKDSLNARTYDIDGCYICKQ